MRSIVWRGQLVLAVAPRPARAPDPRAGRPDSGGRGRALGRCTDRDRQLCGRRLSGHAPARDRERRAAGRHDHVRRCRPPRAADAARRTAAPDGADDRRCDAVGRPRDPVRRALPERERDARHRCRFRHADQPDARQPAGRLSQPCRPRQRRGADGGPRDRERADLRGQLPGRAKVTLSFTRNARVEGNRFLRDESGVTLTGTRGSSVTGNTFDLERGGISDENSRGLVVERNTLTSGFFLIESVDATISRNTVGPKGRIAAGDTAGDGRVRVLDNTIEVGALRTGLSVAAAHRVEVRGNTVKGTSARTNGIFVGCREQSPGLAIVERNTADGSASRPDDRVQQGRRTVRRPRQHDPRATATSGSSCAPRTSALTRNTVEGNGTGIMVEGSCVHRRRDGSGQPPGRDSRAAQRRGRDPRPPRGQERRAGDRPRTRGRDAERGSQDREREHSLPGGEVREQDGQAAGHRVRGLPDPGLRVRGRVEAGKPEERRGAAGDRGRPRRRGRPLGVPCGPARLPAVGEGDDDGNAREGDVRVLGRRRVRLPGQQELRRLRRGDTSDAASGASVFACSIPKGAKAERATLVDVVTEERPEANALGEMLQWEEVQRDASPSPAGFFTREYLVNVSYKPDQRGFALSRRLWRFSIAYERPPSAKGCTARATEVRP